LIEVVIETWRLRKRFSRATLFQCHLDQSKNNEKKCSAGSEIGPRASLTKSTTCMKLSWKIGASPNAALYFKESFYYKLRSTWLYYKSYIILAYAYIKNLNLRSLKGVRAKFKLLIHFNLSTTRPRCPPNPIEIPGGAVYFLPIKYWTHFCLLRAPAISPLLNFAKESCSLRSQKIRWPSRNWLLSPESRLEPPKAPSQIL
jgi:hypothetical protein